MHFRKKNLVMVYLHFLWVLNYAENSRAWSNLVCCSFNRLWQNRVFLIFNEHLLSCYFFSLSKITSHVLFVSFLLSWFSFFSVICVLWFLILPVVLQLLFCRAETTITSRKIPVVFPNLSLQRKRILKTPKSSQSALKEKTLEGL